MSDVMEIRRQGDDWDIIGGAVAFRLKSPNRDQIENRVLQWAEPRVIRNPIELEAALERAEELRGCAAHSDGERELEMISDAVQLYRESIDVMSRVASKAACDQHRETASVDGSE